MSLVLPKSTVDLIGKVADGHRHPGLQLDKFSVPGDQKVQKTALDEVRSIPGDSALLDALIARRQHTMGSLPGAHAFSCTTTGPLTLHLSRASALENAGLCLHPIYGFAYLPGSGLKGMARAYAETVWLPTQTDQEEEAWRRIEEVFGWAPGSDRGKDWKPANIPERPKDDNARVGCVVFHDAWPAAWPPLIVDIVNNHHPAYYQAAPDDNAHPPGDWENPVPVYFLAVKPGTTFDFPLSKRRADVSDDLLTLARQWLLGALCHLGAGAKTNAGYGAFKPADRVDEAMRSAADETWSRSTTVPADSPKRAVFETTLELITPAFLAGADQADQYGNAAKEGCDLRSATLRGHLRWWWRTMHAGFLDVKTLRALEAAIWGDTHTAGAVRIELLPRTRGSASLYTHPQDRRSGARYVAYGMDETSRGQRRQRFRLNPPASWGLRVIARVTNFFVNREDIGDPKKAQNGRPLTAIQVLDQAKAALWLLCTYGGAGSKARKGFGSLAARDLDGLDLGRCRSITREVRQQCSIDTAFSPDRADSPSISDPDLHNIEIPVPAASADDVIERIGKAYSVVASRFKHNVDQNDTIASPNKAAWGLPRKIHGPMLQPLPHQSADTHQQPQWLDFPRRPANVLPQNARHASPIHVHVAKNPSDDFTVRVLAMPAKHLTSRNENVDMLRVFVETFRAEFDMTPARPATARHRAATSSAPPPTTTGPTKRPSGTPVRVRILAERPKGGYDVQEADRPQGTLTVGSPPDPPPSLGDTVDVVIHDDDPKRPQYRWPSPNTKAKRKPKGGTASRRPGRRR